MRAAHRSVGSVSSVSSHSVGRRPHLLACRSLGTVSAPAPDRPTTSWPLLSNNYAACAYHFEILRSNGLTTASRVADGRFPSSIHSGFTRRYRRLYTPPLC